MRRARCMAGLLGIGLLMAVSGCAMATRSSPRELDLTLRSSSGFALQAADGACVVTRARLEVLESRGDTIFYRTANDVRWAKGAPRCRPVGPGHVAVRAHPDLRASTVERESALTLFAVLYAAWAIVTLPGLLFPIK